MKRKFVILVVMTVLALWVRLPAAKAQVKSGDTFSFGIVAHDNYYNNYPLESNILTATFGTTQTFPRVGYNGQDYTITSSETINADGTTTDTFIVTTPTNFLTSTSIDGYTLTSLEFDLGEVDSYGDPVDGLTAVSNSTNGGYVLYGLSNEVDYLNPLVVTLTNNGVSYSAVGTEYYRGSTPISRVAVHNFTFNITYTTRVPFGEFEDWTGGAGDSLWNTAANWSVNAVPDTPGTYFIVPRFDNAGNGHTSISLGAGATAFRSNLEAAAHRPTRSAPAAARR